MRWICWKNTVTASQPESRNVSQLSSALFYFEFFISRFKLSLSMFRDRTFVTLSIDILRILTVYLFVGLVDRVANLLSWASWASWAASSAQAQLRFFRGALSSAQLSSGFSKTGSAQLSELTELTLDDSAVNDVVFCQIDSYWLKPTHNSNISNVIGSFFPVLESWWLFVKMREKWKKWSVRARALQRTILLSARAHSFMRLSPAP